MISLRREPDGALIAGVSTGLAALCGCSPWLIRMGWVLAGLITLKFTLLAYLLLALLLPSRKSGTAERKPRKQSQPGVAKVEALEKEFRDLEERLSR